MKLVITIPKEFEKEFITNRFFDVFSVLCLCNELDCFISNPEKKTVKMLKSAFLNAEIVACSNFLNSDDSCSLFCNSSVNSFCENCNSYRCNNCEYFDCCNLFNKK